MSEEDKDKENKIDQEDSASDQNNQPEDVDKKPDNKDQLQSGSESYMSVDEITSISKNETNESSKTPETKENETTPSSNITETTEIKDNVTPKIKAFFIRVSNWPLTQTFIKFL